MEATQGEVSQGGGGPGSGWHGEPGHVSPAPEPTTREEDEYACDFDFNEDMFRMLDSSVADSQLATALEAQRKEEAATRDEVIQRAIARNEGILRQIKIAHPGRGRYP